jgi:hypothetical protein
MHSYPQPRDVATYIVVNRRFVARRPIVGAATVRALR